MPRNLALYARVTALGAVIVVLALAAILAWDRFSVTGSALGWVNHTYEVRDSIGELTTAVIDAETGQRGYLLTGSTDYLQPYRQATARIPDLQARLAALTADNQGQQQRVAALAPLLQSRLAVMARTIALRESGDADGALALVRSGEGRQYMLAIRAALDTMAAEESRLLASRIGRAASADRLARWLALGVASAGIAALAFATLSLRHALERAEAAEAAQRRLADNLRDCLESLTHGVAVFDRALLLTHVNQNFGGLLGLEARQLCAGLHYTELASLLAANGQDAFLETEEQIRLSAAGPDARAPVGYDRKRNPGPRSFEVRRTALSDGGFVLMVTDTTERVQAEAMLREAQKMHAIGRLTGGIAHDFNNLLMVVLGNLDWVRPRVAEQPAVLTRIDRAIWGAQRGATLTRQLLAFGRRQPLEIRPADLGAIVREIASLLSRTLGETIAIRVIDSAGLWLAMVDTVQVESALLNLALNARDAMPDGGSLTIELGNRVIDRAYAARHAELDAGDYVLIAVSDTGTGMPPDVQEHAFEPFFTTKPEGQGTGLGLSMVHGFVKQSGGHIKLYSEPGEGTTVKLYLPRAPIGATVAVAAAAPLTLAVDGATVLLVEDEPAVREIAAAMLRELGYGVMEAGNGEIALALLAANPDAIALLLVDVILPGKLRGRDLAEQALLLRPGLKVIYMSGYTANAIVHQGRLDDGVVLLNKPFSRLELARVLAEALGRAG